MRELLRALETEWPAVLQQFRLAGDAVRLRRSARATLRRPAERHTQTPECCKPRALPRRGPRSANPPQHSERAIAAEPRLHLMTRLLLRNTAECLSLGTPELRTWSNRGTPAAIRDTRRASALSRGLPM